MLVVRKIDNKLPFFNCYEYFFSFPISITILDCKRNMTEKVKRCSCALNNGCLADSKYNDLAKDSAVEIQSFADLDTDIDSHRIRGYFDSTFELACYGLHSWSYPMRAAEMHFAGLVMMR